MGIFDNLDQADIFENSAYFEPGRYIVDIKRCQFKTNGHKGDNFIVEATVVAVDTDDPKAPTVGKTGAQVWNANADKREMARATWIAFLCSVYGVKQDSYTGEQWKEISAEVLGDSQPLAGVRMSLNTHHKSTRTGGLFTVHKWEQPTPEVLASFGLAA